MDTMDITLIVKASNQQFEDQTIKCEPSWTIRRLKGHLTEVYPGKPSTDEQKLIYSGQLLGDSVVLKDILRHYDGQETHTVHLVFTPKNNRHTRDFGSTSSKGGASSSSFDQQRSSKSMSPKPSSSSDGAVATTSSSAGNSSRSACEDSATRSAPSPSETSFGADGLRQRNVANGAQSSAPAAAVPNPVFAPVSAEYIMSQQLAMQNWMQQVYAQYLNQYMSVISGQSNPQAPHVSAPMNNSAAAAAVPPQLNPAALTSTLPPPPPLAASIVNTNPLFAQTLPNLAYYPYLSAMNSFPMPSASSIPAPISSSGTIPVSTPTPASQPTIPVPATPAPPEPVAGPSGVAPSVGGIQQPMATSSSSSTSSATVNAASAQGPAQPGANPDQSADAAAVPGAAAEAAPAAARRFPNIVVEEQENRDWLDIFFSMCRVGILMTVVYLYSSPIRCIMVLFTGVMLYLYQIGFFRNNNAERIERARRIVVQQINNAHGVRQNVNPRPQTAAAAVPAPAADEQPNNAGETDSSKGEASESHSAASSSSANAAKDTTGSETEQVVPAEAAQSDDQSAANAVPEANRVNVNDVAAFLRTLVLSFFTSIIPDTPAA